MRVAEHEEEMIDLLSDLLRRRKLSAGRDKIVSFGRRPVEDHKLMALGLEMSCHALSHDARTDPANFRSCLHHL